MNTVRLPNWTGVRRFKRQSADNRIQLRCGDLCFRGWAIDISEGGIAVNVLCDFVVGDEVHCLIDFAEDNQLIVKAVVKRTDGFHCALEFLPMSAMQQQQFVHALAQRGVEEEATQAVKQRAPIRAPSLDSPDFVI